MICATRVIIRHVRLRLSKMRRIRWLKCAGAGVKKRIEERVKRKEKGGEERESEDFIYNDVAKKRKLT